MKRERFLCRALRGGITLYSVERYALGAEAALADFRAELVRRAEHAGASVCVDLLPRIDVNHSAAAVGASVACAECGRMHALYSSTFGDEPFRFYCHACACARWGAARVEAAHAYACKHGRAYPTRQCSECTCAHGQTIGCRYCAERRAAWIAGEPCPDARHAAELERGTK